MTDPDLAERVGAGIARELAALALGAALYGAALGSWHGGRLALYSAVKLPVVLLLTSLLTALFQVVVARAVGLGRAPASTLRLATGALARAARLLGALAPVAALMSWSAPPPGVAARTEHNLLFLLHTLAVGACGTAGVAGLRRELARQLPPRAARRVLAAWLLAFALVGGEVAWMLRPFVGSVYEPVTFLRADALDGNVYEFLVLDALPHLLHLDSKGVTP